MIILFSLVMAIGWLYDITALVVIGGIGNVLSLLMIGMLWYISDLFGLRKALT